MTHTERLKAAIVGGDVQTVRESLSRRQVSDTFKDGRTLLHVACQNGKVEIVELFLQHGSRVGARDVNGYTPLHLAAAQGHKEVIKALLEFEAQVDDQDQFGNTSVHMAAWNGFSQSIKLLVQFHANINIQNKVGFTALHTAAQRGHNQSARELLYADAQVDAKNKYGETPLHTSTRHGHAGVTQILINANSNLNSKNKEGESCLHVAAVLQRTKIARLLVEAGAKMSQKNKKGETPLDVACKNNSPEIVNLLQDASVGGRRRRKGLFSFLRRKTTPSNSSREQVLSLDPSLPSSVGSNKNIDQTQGLSRAESFGEIRPERTGQDFSSLDRLGTRRRQRDEEMQTQDVRRPPRQHLPTWNELVERSTGDNPPNLGGADYENFDPTRAAPWGGYNLWHSSPGIVGAHGYSHVALYPQAYGFVPGYEACGGPPVAGMMPPYHVDVRNRPGPSHGGLTNTIEQSMQYYRDLAGNLKQGPASMNPACSGPTPSNQARGLFSPGNYNFLFDVDADQFLHRGADIPAHHLYEPIGIRGPDEPPSDDDDLWRAMEQARRHHRSPGQHRSPPFSGTRRDVNAFPLEPRVFIRNLGASRAQGAGDEIPAANRNYYPNHPVAERLPGSRRRDNFDSERSRERSWQRTIGRPGLAEGRRPSHAQLPRRSHSEETLSSVMGSSHERRRAEQRFASRFRSDNLREGRGRNHRSNTIESGAMTSRRGVRNFPSEIAHHPGATYRSHLRTEPRRNGNRSPEGAVAMTASLREKGENLDLEEDYRSESSGHEEDNGETNVDPDRSLRSSEDDNDGREELPPLDDLVAGTANFNLEELEASPRKRHSPENSSPSEMPGSRNGTSPQPPVETRRQCSDEMEYFRRDLGDIDTSSLEFETSLDNAEVPPLRWERPKSSGVNPTTRPTSIKPGLESSPGRTGRAGGKREPRASKRSDGSPFDVNRVTSV